MNPVSKLLHARRRRSSTDHAFIGLSDERRTGDPRIDFAIVERRWQT